MVAIPDPLVAFTVLGFDDHHEPGADAAFSSQTGDEIISQPFGDEYDRFELLNRFTEWMLDPPFGRRISGRRWTRVATGRKPMCM